MPDREYALDFLKIVATILIVFHHYQQVTGAYFDGVINFYGGKFYFGYVVEFFFIISGFLMYHYIQKIQRGGGELLFFQFMKKRALRLLPLVAISAVVYEILLLMYQHIYQQSWFGISVTFWGTVITSLGIQEGWSLANPCVNNPTWYISVLLLCYVVFYFLTYVSGRLKIPPIYTYVVMIFLGMGIRTYGINLPFLNGQAARGYYAFFFGVLLAYFINNRKISRKIEFASVASLIGITYLIINHYNFMAHGINYTMTFIFYPALIIAFLSNPMKQLFTSKVIGTLGKISFDVYIWHNPMFLLMYILIKVLGITINLNTISAMIIYTIISFAVGTVSYYLVEKPINRYIGRKIRIIRI